MVRYRLVQRKYTHDSQDFCKCSSVDVFVWFSPGAVNRGDVLTACFRDIQSQRSIRMEFVIIMILFDVKDYRLLYGSISALVLKLVWIRMDKYRI